MRGIYAGSYLAPMQKGSLGRAIEMGHVLISFHPETQFFLLPLGRLCRNELKKPSFPRKRESSHGLIQDFSPLDARLRGHDGLRHSLQGEREFPDGN